MPKNEVAHPGSCRFFKAGDWELFIFYSARGTRSEGPRGFLLKNGNLVSPGETVGEEVETDLGKMKYYGMNAMPMWEPEGWLFAEKGEIPRSSDN